MSKRTTEEILSGMSDDDLDISAGDEQDPDWQVAERIARGKFGGPSDADQLASRRLRHNQNTLAHAMAFKLGTQGLGQGATLDDRYRFVRAEVRRQAVEWMGKMASHIDPNATVQDVEFVDSAFPTVRVTIGVGSVKLIQHEISAQDLGNDHETGEIRLKYMVERAAPPSLIGGSQDAYFLEAGRQIGKEIREARDNTVGRTFSERDARDIAGRVTRKLLGQSSSVPENVAINTPTPGIYITASGRQFSPKVYVQTDPMTGTILRQDSLVLNAQTVGEFFSTTNAELRAAQSPERVFGLMRRGLNTNSDSEGKYAGEFFDYFGAAGMQLGNIFGFDKDGKPIVHSTIAKRTASGGVDAGVKRQRQQGIHRQIYADNLETVGMTTIKQMQDPVTGKAIDVADREVFQVANVMYLSSLVGGAGFSTGTNEYYQPVDSRINLGKGSNVVLYPDGDDRIVNKNGEMIVGEITRKDGKIEPITVPMKDFRNFLGFQGSFSNTGLDGDEIEMRYSGYGVFHPGDLVAKTYYGNKATVAPLKDGLAGMGFTDDRVLRDEKEGKGPDFVMPYFKKELVSANIEATGKARLHDLRQMNKHQRDAQIAMWASYDGMDKEGLQEMANFASNPSAVWNRSWASMRAMAAIYIAEDMAESNWQTVTMGAGRVNPWARGLFGIGQGDTEFQAQIFRQRQAIALSDIHGTNTREMNIGVAQIGLSQQVGMMSDAEMKKMVTHSSNRPYQEIHMTRFLNHKDAYGNASPLVDERPDQVIDIKDIDIRAVQGYVRDKLGNKGAITQAQYAQALREMTGPDGTYLYANKLIRVPFQRKTKNSNDVGGFTYTDDSMVLVSPKTAAHFSEEMDNGRTAGLGHYWERIVKNALDNGRPTEWMIANYDERTRQLAPEAWHQMWGSTSTGAYTPVTMDLSLGPSSTYLGTDVILRIASGFDKTKSGKSARAQFLAKMSRKGGGEIIGQTTRHPLVDPTLQIVASHLIGEASPAAARLAISLQRGMATSILQAGAQNMDWDGDLMSVLVGSLNKDDAAIIEHAIRNQAGEDADARIKEFRERFKGIGDGERRVNAHDAVMWASARTLIRRGGFVKVGDKDVPIGEFADKIGNPANGLTDAQKQTIAQVLFEYYHPAHEKYNEFSVMRGEIKENLGMRKDYVGAARQVLGWGLPGDESAKITPEAQTEGGIKYLKDKASQSLYNYFQIRGLNAAGEDKYERRLAMDINAMLYQKSNDFKSSEFTPETARFVDLARSLRLFTGNVSDGSAPHLSLRFARNSLSMGRDSRTGRPTPFIANYASENSPEVMESEHAGSFSQGIHGFVKDVVETMFNDRFNSELGLMPLQDRINAITKNEDTRKRIAALVENGNGDAATIAGELIGGRDLQVALREIMYGKDAGLLFRYLGGGALARSANWKDNISAQQFAFNLAMFLGEKDVHTAVNDRLGAALDIEAIALATSSSGEMLDKDRIRALKAGASGKYGTAYSGIMGFMANLMGVPKSLANGSFVEPDSRNVIIQDSEFRILDMLRSKPALSKQMAQMADTQSGGAYSPGMKLTNPAFIHPSMFLKEFDSGQLMQRLFFRDFVNAKKLGIGFMNALRRSGVGNAWLDKQQTFGSMEGKNPAGLIGGQFMHLAGSAVSEPGIQKEISFEAPVRLGTGEVLDSDQIMIGGTMDRIIVDDAKKAWIEDYKILAYGDPAKAKKHYLAQMALYGSAFDEAGANFDYGGKMISRDNFMKSIGAEGFSGARLLIANQQLREIRDRLVGSLGGLAQKGMLKNHPAGASGFDSTQLENFRSAKNLEMAIRTIAEDTHSNAAVEHVAREVADKMGVKYTNPQEVFSALENMMNDRNNFTAIEYTPQELQDFRASISPESYMQYIGAVSGASNLWNEIDNSKEMKEYIAGAGLPAMTNGEGVIDYSSRIATSGVDNDKMGAFSSKLLEHIQGTAKRLVKEGALKGPLVGATSILGGIPEQNKSEENFDAESALRGLGGVSSSFEAAAAGSGGTNNNGGAENFILEAMKQAIKLQEYHDPRTTLGRLKDTTYGIPGSGARPTLSSLLGKFMGSVARGENPNMMSDEFRPLFYGEGASIMNSELGQSVIEMWRRMRNSGPGQAVTFNDEQRKALYAITSMPDTELQSEDRAAIQQMHYQQATGNLRGSGTLATTDSESDGFKAATQQSTKALTRFAEITKLASGASDVMREQYRKTAEQFEASFKVFKNIGEGYKQLHIDQNALNAKEKENLATGKPMSPEGQEAQKNLNQQKLLLDTQFQQEQTQMDILEGKNGNFGIVSGAKRNFRNWWDRFSNEGLITPIMQSFYMHGVMKSFFDPAQQAIVASAQNESTRTRLIASTGQAEMSKLGPFESAQNNLSMNMLKTQQNMASLWMPPLGNVSNFLQSTGLAGIGNIVGPAVGVGAIGSWAAGGLGGMFNIKDLAIPGFLIPAAITAAAGAAGSAQAAYSDELTTGLKYLDMQQNGGGINIPLQLSKTVDSAGHYINNYFKDIASGNYTKPVINAAFGMIASPLMALPVASQMYDASKKMEEQIKKDENLALRVRQAASSGLSGPNYNSLNAQEKAGAALEAYRGFGDFRDFTGKLIHPGYEGWKNVYSQEEFFRLISAQQRYGLGSDKDADQLLRGAIRGGIDFEKAGAIAGSLYGVDIKTGLNMWGSEWLNGNPAELERAMGGMQSSAYFGYSLAGGEFNPNTAYGYGRLGAFGSMTANLGGELIKSQFQRSLTSNVQMSDNDKARLLELQKQQAETNVKVQGDYLGIGIFGPPKTIHRNLTDAQLESNLHEQKAIIDNYSSGIQFSENLHSSFGIGANITGPIGNAINSQGPAAAAFYANQFQGVLSGDPILLSKWSAQAVSAAGGEQFAPTSQQSIIRQTSNQLLRIGNQSYTTAGMPLFTTNMMQGGVNLSNSLGLDKNSTIYQALNGNYNALNLSGAVRDDVGGIWGLQQYASDLGYKSQMASIGASIAQLKLNWAFQTGEGIGKYGNRYAGQVLPWTEGIKNPNYVKDSDRPDQGEFLQARTGQKNFEGISFWNLEDRSTKIQREQEAWGLFMQQRGRDQQISQFTRNFDFNQAQAIKQYGWQQEDFGYQRSQVMRQRSWAVEDLGLQRQANERRFGWAMEDANENIRFMTGRDRRLAERQIKRMGIEHNVEEEGFDRAAKRQKEQWASEDKRFDVEKKRAEDTHKVNLQRMDMEKAFFYERMALETANFEKQKQWLVEKQEIEDIQRQMQRTFSEEQKKIQESALGAQAYYATEQKKINETLTTIGQNETIITSSMQTRQKTEMTFYKTLFIALGAAINAIKPGEGDDLIAAAKKFVMPELPKNTGGVQRNATGFVGVVNKPTRFLAGEEGSEMMAIYPNYQSTTMLPNNSSFGGFGNTTVTVYLDGKEIAGEMEIRQGKTLYRARRL